MFYSESLIEEVRIRNDIVSVVSSYVSLTRQGRRMVGLCPFHSEKTPSFSVDATKQMFYCFGCQKGGNVFHFVMNIENLDFPEALKQLADRAGVVLPESEDKGERERSELKKEISRLNTEAARYFYRNLAGPGGMEAQKYLLNRGLPQNIVKKFGLGYAEDSWNALSQHFIRKGVSSAVLEKAGLAFENPNGMTDKFRNRIMFPIFDIRGNVVAFGGRVMDKSQPKYMNSPETLLYSKSKELYGMNFARVSKSKQLVMVEGYMDVISLHAAGIDTAVASLGTAFTQQQAWVLKKYAEEVIVAFDSDLAGQNAAVRGIEILENAGCAVRVLQVPEGKDPDDYVRKHGPERFRRLMDDALTLLEFRLLLQKKQNPGETPDNRVQLLNGMADVLAMHGNAIEREMTLKNLAGEYKVSIESLKTEVDKRLHRRGIHAETTRVAGRFGSSNTLTGMTRRVSKFGDTAWNRYDESELLLLCLLGNENRLVEEVILRMPLTRYKGNLSKDVAVKLYDRLLRNHEASLAELVNDLASEAASAIIHLSETKGTVENPEKAVEDLLRRLERTALEDEKQWILDTLRNEKDEEKRKGMGMELNRVITRMSEVKNVSQS